MEQKDPVSQPQRRAIQYWYMDGTFELSFGLFCLVLGAYLYVENLLQGTRLVFLVDVLLVAVVIGGSFLMKGLVQRWKERVTYPRTGFISYRRKGSRGRAFLQGMVVIAILGLLVWLLSYVDVPIATRPLVTGILFGVVLGFLGWRTGLRRFSLHAILSVLVGIGLAFSPLGNYAGLATFYGLIGLILLVSGGLILRNYLLQNPALQEE